MINYQDMINAEDCMVEYYYHGDDLGYTYSKQQTKFRVWAPTAKKINVLIYEDDQQPVYESIQEMEKSRNGTWLLKLNGDYEGKYFTYKVHHENFIKETVDPYTVAVGTNSQRGLIVDMEQTNPAGWDQDQRVFLQNRVDAVIYEVHVRDFTVSMNSGVKQKGKYSGFVEGDTTSDDCLCTGLDHLKQLGITHVHLLPVFDFGSVDDGNDNDYNWGYDPLFYNVPEGSYSTNPADDSRIKEFKHMVKVLHNNNIGVIMDVVYNHTFQRLTSPFNILVPDYYYRFNKKGDCSNGSGCGNEIASEKPMVRKFIIDSLKFWANEYHIDGFRFDLMGLIDKKTLDLAETVLHRIDPSILIYGEPWKAGYSPLVPDQQMKKGEQSHRQIALFNDHFRDAIKGDNDGVIRGFATGDHSRELQIKKGVAGSINYNEQIRDFTAEPGETINYISSHDNLTLWDKISKSNTGDSEIMRIKKDRLAQAIIFTSQGVAFMAGGEEFLRTKYGNHNSYNAGDYYNQFKWERKSTYYSTFKYIQGLINLRRAHPAFRMACAEQIRNQLQFLTTPENTVGFLLQDYANSDSWRDIVVFYNPNHQDLFFHLPGDGTWQMVVNDNQAGINPLKEVRGFRVSVPAISAVVMYRE